MSDDKQLANYDEMLAKLAKKATSVEKPSSATIGTRAGILTYGGQPVAGNKLQIIVLESRHVNKYYEDGYDSDNPKNPVCFAYSPDGENMVPHPKASKPQYDNCKDCPMNKWGSAGEGRKGKACKNTRHLAMLPMDVKAADIPTAEVAMISLPVTSVQNWSNYVHKLSTLFNRPPLGMFTTIGTEPNVKHQYHITFTDNGVVPIELIPGLMQRAEDPAIVQMLEVEYDANSEEPAGEEKPGKTKKF